MTDIPARIYNAFSKSIMKNTRGRSGFYPSSVSVKNNNEEIEGSCLREEYYRWFKAKPTEDFNPEFGLISLSGEALHTIIADFIRGHPLETELLLLKEEHAFFDEDNMLSGRIDMFLMDLKDQSIFGCDIKTVSDYAAGVCINQPRVKDILQCAIYLDQYQKSIHSNNKPIDAWIILYFARSENYKLKKYPHGSPFKNMWQFLLSFNENNEVVLENQFGSKTTYDYITRKSIYERYKVLYKYIKSKQLPPRDFEYQYSEERIVGMYKQGKVQFKKDRTPIEKWLESGAPEGELKLEMGDFNCRFCSYKTLCWSGQPENYEKQSTDYYDLRDTKIIIPTEPLSVISKEVDDYI